MFNIFKRGSSSSDDFRAQVRAAFERELTRRGATFTVEAETGRYQLEIDGWKIAVALDNLLKEVEDDRDFGRVARFVDTVFATPGSDDTKIASERLFWSLEPNDYVDKADYRVAVSDKVDRVLTHFSVDETKLTWVTLPMLETAGLSLEAAGAAAFQSLSQALAAARIEFDEIGEARLGFVNTTLPFKASLLLAPNLREGVESTLGWPLQAVAPDRNFLYLWAARHEDFVGRVGHVVVNEFTKASYPLSTEVYSVSDDGVLAIGAFPTEK